MNDKLKAELSKEVPTPMHDQLLHKVQGLLTMSRSSISKHYPDWDAMQKLYDSERDVDREDRKNASTGSPTKIAVPLTYAQVNTFVAFMFMMFHQRERFFELETSGGPEDDVIRELCEKVLQADLNANTFSLILYQFLLDIARFGIGVFKTSWEMEEGTFLQDGAPDTFDGLNHRTEKLFQSMTTFEGNKILSVSPYKFFYDTRLPLSRFQEGEFCASEEEFPRHQLSDWEAMGKVAGIEQIQPFNATSISLRENVSRFTSIDVTNRQTQETNVCITEFQVKLVPDRYELEDGTKLGNTSKPITFLIWVANDSRIIRIEPLNYLHNQFTYDVGQFSPDQHKELSTSLASQVDNLQKLTDWFFNSHVASVHRTLDNQLVVDPSVIDMRTVVNNSRVIKTKMGAPRVGIDRFIKQLPVQDVTSNHMNDISSLSSVMETVTGINQTAQGQFHSGRRSATEARGAISGSASRLSLYGKMIWEGALKPLGKKMVINSRQSLTQEGFQAVVGQNQEQLQQFPQYKSDIASLVRKADFFVFDGTLPSEKQYTAQSLQELLNIVASMPPEMLGTLQIDISALIKEIFTLRGIRNMERFAPKPGQPNMNQLIAQQQQQQQQPTQ